MWNIRALRCQGGAVWKARRQMPASHTGTSLRAFAASHRVSWLERVYSRVDTIDDVFFCVCVTRFGIICAFVSNANAQDGINSLPTALRHTTEDTATYFNHTRKVSSSFIYSVCCAPCSFLLDVYLAAERVSKLKWTFSHSAASSRSIFIGIRDIVDDQLSRIGSRHR